MKVIYGREIEFEDLKEIMEDLVYERYLNLNKVSMMLFYY
jgi:hypothetical protein